MKTMYRLLFWSSPSACAEQRDLYETAQEAMAAGQSQSPDWHAGRAGTVGADGFWTTPNKWGVTPEQVPENDSERIQLAIELALKYGQVDGDHHKMWVIDGMLRLLAGDRYEALVAGHEAPDGHGDAYEWEAGVAP